MISRDIKAVYGTGFVDDVVVDVTPRGDGVIVTFQVDEKPAVREVKITGNKKIDEDSLREAIDISSFAVLNELDVAQNVERLRDKYVEKGYYLVQVEPKIQDVGNDQVDLTFDVTENRKVIVQTIDITGNDHIPDRKVRKYLQTKQAGILPWLTNSGTFNEDNLENDVQIVKTVFLEEGYVDVKVDEPRVFLSPDKRSIYLSIHVEEGPQYQIGAVRIEGDFVAEEGLTPGAARQIVNGDTARTVNGRWQRALARGRDGQPEAGWDDPDVGDGFLVFNEKHPALETGETFKLSAMQLTMQEISDLYGDQGYAFANVIPMPDTDPDARVVDIVFDIQRGEKVRIGRIEITGNDPTYDKVVRREIPINEGEIYRGSALKEARQRLDRLGYFEEAKISTPRGTEPDVLDMNVEVTEQPTGSFSVGAGFSNLDNFMFTANVAKNNFLGLGYIMRAEANISSRRQQWDLYFYEPFFLDTRWALRARLFSDARQYVEDEYGRGGSLAIGR
ncbi:MAG: BamA/TamA family outer membrane protein, partial [Phycisphaerales bacterium]|nr:BamA/TamA family outer membrane protein [Phycisphaerales bacterium]